MKNKVTLFILSLLFTTAIFAQDKGNPSSNILRQTLDAYGNPKAIIFKEDVNLRLEQSDELFTKYLKISKEDNMVQVSSLNDQLGYTHDKFQQYHNGLKVEFTNYTLHAKNGRVESMMGEYQNTKGISTTPSMSAISALSKATAHVGAESYAWEDELQAKALEYEKPEGELVIFPKMKGINDAVRLAYKFDIYSHDPLYRADVYVDAHSGVIIYENARIHHADTPASGASLYNGTVSFTADSNSGSYRLRQTSDGDGIQTFDLNNGTNYNNASDITSSSTTFNHQTGVQAHWGAEQTHKYFFQNHSRNSFNGTGGTILSYVSYSSNYVNAFWDGTRMTYGDGDGTNYGPLVSLDIVGHEITHGVTEYSANLVYSYESGALNESFSDIFGESIEYFGQGTNDWLMGDQIGAGGSGGALRSFSNPNAYSQPDTYLGTSWYSGTADNGGVHYNSGVQNFWFYLLSTGGSGTNDNGDSYTVSQIGMDKAAAVAYRNLTVYLNSSSQYDDARTGAIQAAIDLYGSGSAEEIAVTNAWYAVGVGAEYVQTCALGAPSNLASSNVADNSFTVSWNSVSGATSYEVSINGSPTTVSGTSYTFTGLIAGTSYSVSVTANCSTGGSGASSTINVTTTGTPPVTYCDSASTNINDEYIGRVQLGSIDNSSGGQYYTDFTTISTDLTKGDSYTITVTPTWTGTVYSEGYSVWIDYNQDGDFADSGEQVWTQSATQTTPVSGSFTVPSSASNGATRMRVSMKYNGVPTSCETFTYGEVEDYTVNLGDGTPTPDTTAPVITLNGPSTINLTVGDTYTEQGATATDNVDGDLTSSITTSGTVDTSTAGTYTVTYSVSDAAGNSTSTTRTVIVSEPAPDTTAPVITLNGSDTINLTVGDNYTELGATATDDTDGDLTSSIVTSGTVDTSTAGTYTVTYSVSDAAGNSASATRTVIVSEPSTGSTTTVHEGYFESGWDGWSDGGSDCARYSGSRSYEGSYSIRLRDNSGTGSAMTSSSFDLSSYDTVEVQFYFYSYSMENGEDFWLRFYNGSSWSTVAAWARGTSFNNNTFYTATVTLDAANYNLASNSQFRFQCDASGNADYIYIDQVTIKGIIGSGYLPNNSIQGLSGGMEGFAINTEVEDEFEYDFKMYPNPATNALNIELLDDVDSATFKIVNLLGQTVKSGELRQQFIDVSGLQSGLYIIEVNDGEENMTRRFIKQ